MLRTRPRAAGPRRLAAVLSVVGVVVAACGGGEKISATPADRDCTAVTQAANAIQIVDGATATSADVDRSAAGSAALTQAAASATTAVAAPAGQLATAAKAYVAALQAHNVEGVNTTGGVLRQRAQAVADVCKTTVLGVAPQGPTS